MLLRTSSCGRQQTLEDLRLAEQAGMVFPAAEAGIAPDVEVGAEVGDRLEQLTAVELQERRQVLGVMPGGIYRDMASP
jgi:hypothetical protein